MTGPGNEIADAGAAVSFTAVMTTMVALFPSMHGAAVLVNAAVTRSGRRFPRRSG